MSDKKQNENEARLKQLASDIQAGHRRIIDNVRGTISLARLNGQWLMDARKLVPHGYWKAWVRDNCRFSDRMALKYMNVARHYEALIALFGTEDEWTLTEFFALAAELEARAKKDRAGEKPDADAGSNPSKKPAPADTFRLEKRERSKKLKQFEKRKRNGPLPVETSEPVQNFLKAQRERLLGAIRKFACSKTVKEVASDLDPVHLGILLLEGLKSQLDAEELFASPTGADTTDATDASKPPEPGNRIGHHFNGNGREKKQPVA